MQSHIYEIDLHGISMNEAKMVLDEVLEYVHEDMEVTEIHIVVGVGNGSENGPVLPAYVSNYLDDKGYEYTQERGIIHVHVR